MTRKSPKPDDPKQSERFIEAAREAEADETKEGADAAFKSIVSSTPATPSQRTPSPKQ
jgi:hypothetical protein